jgi:membrane protein
LSERRAREHPAIASSPGGDEAPAPERADHPADVFKRSVATVDGWQRRHAAGGFPIAVAKKFGEDRASNLAVLITYYAFVSLFPLLLAFVSILGFVLEDHPALRADVVDSALARIPVLGSELSGQVQPLTGSGVALVIGLVGALWAGLGVTVALGRAFAEIADVPRLQQRNGLKARARGVALLAILAALLIASTAVAGLAFNGGIAASTERAVAIAGSMIVNGIALLTTFALLSPRPRHLRHLLPGVALATVGTLVLQALGGWFVDHTIADATAVYGTFAIVIGLLSWFLLGSHLLLLAAEINAVLRWRLWPRALAGELEPADQRVFERAVQSTRMDARERIAVGFREPPAGNGS